MGDLITTAYTLLVLIGIVLLVWMMALIYHGFFIRFDPPQIRFARRAALAIMGVALCWDTSFAFDTTWVPWPPDVMLLTGLDLYFGIAIVSAYRRMRLESETTSPPARSHRARYPSG